MPGVNLPNGFDKEEFKQAARKFANMLPQRENCDLDNPYEMFLWALVALPGMNGGYQAMPTSYNMLVSEALHRRGAMLKCESCGHVKEPADVYVPPAADDPHWMTTPGRWVPADKAPQRSGDPLDDAIDKLSNQQQAALLQRLGERHKKGIL